MEDTTSNSERPALPEKEKLVSVLGERPVVVLILLLLLLQEEQLVLEEQHVVGLFLVHFELIVAGAAAH